MNKEEMKQDTLPKGFEGGPTGATEFKAAEQKNPQQIGDCFP